MSDISKVQLPSGDIFDIVDKKSGYITGMEILSYGNSTWQDFIDAYNAKKVVYCRASSNSNPASGSQTRLAFMAYVSNADNPTNVEFQYYRSVSSHTASQQGDQVFVYKLDKTAGWTVTTREASVKIDINSNNEGIETTYSNGVVSIGHANSVTAQTTQAVYPIAYDAQGHITSSGSAVTIPTQASDIGAIANSEKGAASGVVPLDSNSLIDEQYLPSYVDDVIEGYYYEGNFYEDSAHTTSITGETGKIYIDLTESKSYRWSGTVFVEITSGGHTYTAGNGIDISAGDVISIDTDDVQEKLVSGTNIKTINNTSLLGSGNLSIEGVPHVDLTQVQYDALTPAEKNNGTIYFITDGESGGGIVDAGIIKMYGGQYAPSGWLFCDGSAVSRADYPFLFAVIGTTFGSGDGSTTFNLPDLRGRVPLGAGTGDASDATAHALADKEGEETHPLTEEELPNISGSFNIRRIYNENNHIVVGTPTGHFKRENSSLTIRPAAYNSSTTEVAEDVVTYEFGSDRSHNNLQPSLTVNFIISTGDVTDWSDSTSELPIVRGVQVDGVSVVNDGVAEIDLTGKQDKFEEDTWHNITLSGVTSKGTNQYRKMNGFIEVYVCFSASNAHTSYTAASDALPTGYRPKAPVQLLGATNTTTTVEAHIDTDGVIRYYTSAATGAWLTGHAIYSPA